jgi:hypothetical protein
VGAAAGLLDRRQQDATSRRDEESHDRHHDRPRTDHDDSAHPDAATTPLPARTGDRSTVGEYVDARPDSQRGSHRDDASADRSGSHRVDPLPADRPTDSRPATD